MKKVISSLVVLLLMCCAFQVQAQATGNVYEDAQKFLNNLENPDVVWK